MRCLALADSLVRDGWECAFAATAETFDVVPVLAAAAHRHAVLDPEDWNNPAAAKEAAACDLLVVDHYGLARDYEAGCRGWAGSILVLDDLADRPHDCDFLLDSAGDAARYHGLAPPESRMLMGPTHALLAREFATARRAVLPRAEDRATTRILVAFGAADTENMTGDALAVLSEVAPDAEVDIVLGPAAQHLDAVRASVDAASAELHVGTKDMVGLMARADIAVGASGVTAWERCCLGLPSVAVAAADNQRQTALCLAKSGAATVLDRYSPDSLADELSRLCADPEARAAMSRRAAALCDGRGADRVRLAISPPQLAKDGASVTLRLANEADTEMLLGWQRDPRTRQFARNPEVPDRDAHYRWMAARLVDPDCLLNIVEHGGAPAGVVRLDRAPYQGAAAECWEVSIYTAPDRHGGGVGLAALALARGLVPDAEIIADVLPENEASHALFHRAGYVWCEGMYRLAPTEAAKSEERP